MMGAMKRLLATLAVLLTLTAAACSSSSNHSAATSSSTSTTKAKAKAQTTIGTGKTTEDAQVCGAIHEFQGDVNKLGSTPAEFQATAATLHATAAKFTTGVPAAAASSAQAYAAAMNKAADQIATATSTSQAQQALIPLVYNTAKDPGISAFATWVAQNC